jgi:hypothetical protein
MAIEQATVEQELSSTICLLINLLDVFTLVILLSVSEYSQMSGSPGIWIVLAAVEQSIQTTMVSVIWTNGRNVLHGNKSHPSWAMNKNINITCNNFQDFTELQFMQGNLSIEINSLGPNQCISHDCEYRCASVSHRYLSQKQRYGYGSSCIWCDHNLSHARCRTRRSRSSETCSMSDISGEYPGHGTIGTFLAARNYAQILATWGRALSCWNMRWWPADECNNGPQDLVMVSLCI